MWAASYFHLGSNPPEKRPWLLRINGSYMRYYEAGGCWRPRVILHCNEGSCVCMALIYIRYVLYPMLIIDVMTKYIVLVLFGLPMLLFVLIR